MVPVIIGNGHLGSHEDDSRGGPKGGVIKENCLRSIEHQYDYAGTKQIRYEMRQENSRVHFWAELS